MRVFSSTGGSVINQADNTELKEYLLGRLSTDDEERVEMRLLTEPEFAEEFDIAVNDLTDAYVTGEIQGDDRRRAETYFFKSVERQNKLKYALALKAHKRQRPLKKAWWAAPSVRIAASLVLMVGVGYLVWSIIPRQNNVDEGLLALRGAYRDERPVEARISGWQYAPAVSRRGEEKVDYRERDRAASLLQTAVNDRREAASLQALGQSYLAAREFDKAIDQFEDALKLSNTAKIQSDLGAALLEKGKAASQGKGVEYFARALEHLTRAVELDSSLLEALFNRALTYKYLGLPDKAEQDWRLYLDKDPNSQWSNEAREELKKIEEIRQKTSQTPNQIFDEFAKRIDTGDRESAWRLVRENQNRSGNVVIEQLLDNYLQRGIDTELQRLASIAEMDLMKNGDRFYTDVSTFYRSAKPEQRELAKQARQLMKQSHADWWQEDGAKSVARFREAKTLFEKAGDFAEAKYADYWVAFAHYRIRANDAGVLELIQPLLATCESNKYVWLKVRCLYLRSSNEFALNRHSKAISSAREAMKLAENINDPVGLLNVVSALVHYYRYVGNYDKSLVQIQKALPIINSQTLDPITGSRHYGFAAFAFAAAGFYDAALSYQEAALRIAPRNPDVMSYQHAFLGAINGKRRQFDDALRNVGTAWEIATKNSRKSLMAYSALERGHIYREMGDCDKAVNSYSQSIDLYNALENFETHIYHAYKGRFVCYLAQKDDARTQHEMETMFRLMENYREQIQEENNRNTFFEIEQSVYDMAIDFEASRMNNPDRAFEYLQYSRGRSLLDLLNTGANEVVDLQDPENVFNGVTQPESSATIKDKLPEHTQLIQYAVLDDKILIWLISRHDVALKRVDVSQQVLNETIERYLRVVSKPSARDEESALAKQLYSLLVQPVVSMLDKKNVICIIPDKNLSFVPFTALVSDSGKYLIEDYVLTTSQSPSIFLHCWKKAVEKSKGKQERALSVGNPGFDRAAFPQLDNLPNAEQEAIDVAKLYKNNLPLLGPNATSAAVRNQMIKSDVVHLAVHSVLDDDVPLDSKLLLATDESQSNLNAYEIYRLKMPRTRLVVLSSCQSGAERYYDGEGMASLARAFLGAGVPLVVASLWPVDSKATEKLMVNFHRARSQGSSAEALAKAQREMLQDPENRYRSPYYWAAFSLNGGYAEF